MPDETVVADAAEASAPVETKTPSAEPAPVSVIEHTAPVDLTDELVPRTEFDALVARIDAFNLNSPHRI